MSLRKALDEIDDDLTSRRGRRAPPAAKGEPKAEGKVPPEHEPVHPDHPLIGKLCDDCREKGKKHIGGER